MRFLLWAAILIGLSVWTLLAWIGHGLVPVAADVVAATPAWLGVDASAAALVSGAIEALVPFAEWTIILIWALGALLLLGAPIVIGRASRHVGDGLASAALAWLGRRRAGRGQKVIAGIAKRIDTRASGPYSGSRW